MINHYARAGSFTTKVGIPGTPTLAFGLVAPLLGSHVVPELYLTYVGMTIVGSIPMKSENKNTKSMIVNKGALA